MVPTLGIGLLQLRTSTVKRLMLLPQQRPGLQRLHVVYRHTRDAFSIRMAAADARWDLSHPFDPTNTGLPVNNHHNRRPLPIAISHTGVYTSGVRPGKRDPLSSAAR
jgi:hypothetical protein